LGRGSPHQPNWLFWECKPTYIAENKTYVSYFFQGFKYESISTPKITDKVGASGVLYLA
jgi:hypothetical protein